MASANNSGSAGCGQLNEAKACTPDQPLPHPHFQAGENSLVRRQRSPTSAKTKERPRKRLRQPNSGLAKHHPWVDQKPSARKRKELRWADEIKASEQATPIDQSLIETMDLEQFNTQPTQELRRRGRPGSGMDGDDVADVICFLHPTTPAACDAVSANIEHNPKHVFPNADLTTEHDDSLFDPAAIHPPSGREICLRMSSKVSNPQMGFTFGRNPRRCDILVTNDANDWAVSGRHFRIYLTKDGILMLQDTSRNGTLVDEHLLKCETEKNATTASLMLTTGALICLLGNPKREIKFLVRIPNRGEHIDAYNANLARYVEALPGPKSKLVRSAADHGFGMQWNGGAIYNVVGCLGKGAFATVYKLATKRDGQLYAAKELEKRRFLKNGILDIKFDNEIQIMKKLRHPNIVQYEDYHDHDDWAYIIMELVPGGELSTYTHEHGPLPESTVQTITRQILHALAYLHARGITHRDIKPDNILIAEEDPLQVKLSDFGLSKCVTNQETFLKTFCGTLLYCAPEIYPGYGDYEKTGIRKRRRTADLTPKRYSDRVDMWSFGAVLFHILCNKPPVISEGENKAAVMLNNIMTKDIDFGPLHALNISEEAIDFISALLKRNPALRPSPKACFQHAWIAEVADLIDYMNLDDEMPAYRGQGLSTVEEADEELLTRSEDAEYDKIFGPGGGLSDVYLNTAGERVSKRQRIIPAIKDQATLPPSDEVAYPKLPKVTDPMVPPARNGRGERLFGEITSSALQSSGVLGVTQPPATCPAAQQGLEQISVNDFVTFDASEPSPSTDEYSEQMLQYPRALGIPGAAPGSAPSLEGAEAQIGQLHMTSPEAVHSEVTTPEAINPMTPETREMTPATNQEEKSDESEHCQEPPSDVSEEPKFSRYIDLQIPENMAHDTDFVNKFNATQAEAKERRARKATERERQRRIAVTEKETQAQKAQTFGGVEGTKHGTEELAKTIDAPTGVEVSSESRNSSNSGKKISRRIELPPLESLYPQTATTPDGFTRPFQRFGKLVSVPGSYTNATIYINSRMTSWGRGLSCNVKHDDLSDTRIPQYAIQITYHAPGMDAWTNKGQPWETAPGIHTVVSTGASRCIWVNDVELRKESSEERAAYYGKIYTGDIITVFKSALPDGPFLKFRVEINYGDSARRRPESEKGFQVLREKVWYKREMKRRESVQSGSKEASPSGSASGAN